VSVNRPCANPAPTLDDRPGGSKFASRNVAVKLHLSLLICALLATFQLVASHESTSPSATGVHCYLSCCKDHTIFSKPNFLALLLSRTLNGSGEQQCLTIVIWLILPVVICLSQRLSHACLSINVIQ
jgi:hypothetical protein